MAGSGESENENDRSVNITCSAERVLAVDPTAVWALVADPARVGEWAAVTTVGYMGTELPKTGQAVFVRTSRWQKADNARRIEIEAWEAGAGYRCVVEGRRSRSPICFEVGIKPEVAADAISTRVRLTQRIETSGFLAAMLRRFICGRLERKLDRIETATAG